MSAPRCHECNSIESCAYDRRRYRVQTRVHKVIVWICRECLDKYPYWEKCDDQESRKTI